MLCLSNLQIVLLLCLFELILAFAVDRMSWEQNLENSLYGLFLHNALLYMENVEHI